MKIKNLVCGLMLSFCFFSKAFAWSAPERDAAGWSHRYVKSNNGIVLGIDYKLSASPAITNENGHYTGYNYVTPVYFNVYGAPANSEVKVQIEFYEQRYTHVGPNAPLNRVHNHYDRTIHLNRTDSNTFTASTPSLVVERFDSSAGDGYFVYQRINVIVDGKPLIDSVSGTPNFQVLLINR